MKRINSWANATDTKEAELDLGDGLTMRLPLGRPYSIDQSAGRVIKVWDYLNKREQIIYGDTGDRTADALLAPPVTAGFSRIRREGRTVEIYLNQAIISGLASSAVALSLPSGFRPSITQRISDTWGLAAGAYAYVDSNGLRFSNTAGGSSSIVLSARFTTNDPWPVELPGSPSGALPA